MFRSQQPEHEENQSSDEETLTQKDLQRHVRMLEHYIAYGNRKLEAFISSYDDRSTIDLSCQKLTDLDMATVTKYAVLGKQCKGLNLWGNLFTDQSISTLASVLNKNQTLRELDLSRNHLSDKGVHIISKVLSLDNCLLKEIDLSSNRITDKGVEDIANMLRKNNTLERLSLNDNEITDHGLILLADALTDNKKLKQLKLEQSPHEPNPRITRTGVESILDLLKDNHTLKEIYLKGHVNKQIKTELEEEAALKTEIFLFL